MSSNTHSIWLPPSQFEASESKLGNIGSASWISSNTSTHYQGHYYGGSEFFNPGLQHTQTVGYFKYLFRCRGALRYSPLTLEILSKA